MMDKVWKSISDKRPKGLNLIKMVGIVSILVWIGAIAAIFLLKDKQLPALAEGLGHGGAKVAFGHGGHAQAGGEAIEAGAPDSEESTPDEETEDESGTELAGHKTETGEAGLAAAGAHGGEAAQGSMDGEEHAASGAEAGRSSAAAALPSREELAALRQVAELFIAAGEPAKAVTPMRRVMMMPTRDAVLLTMATDVFLSTGNYPEALGFAEQVLALKPDDMRVKVQAVEAQYRMGRVEKAVADAQAVLKEHPGELAMLTTLGTMEVEMGPGHDGYGKSLKTALKLKPDYAPALYLQGRKAQLEGDYKDAETAFRKVVKLEPQNAKAHGQLGMALYHLGKEKEAEKEYRAELSMNPEDYNTWFNLGELQMSYAAKERLPNPINALRTEAMESYLKALEFNPDHAQAHYRVGVLLNGNGQYREAIRHLEAALKADSHHVPTLVQLSLAFENLKQPERARAYLTKAYELDPLNKVILFKLKQWS